MIINQMTKYAEPKFANENMWLKVLNPDGIKNENCFFEFGDKGVITLGSEIKLIAECQGNYLCKVAAFGRRRPAKTTVGTGLPIGAIFYLTETEVAEHFCNSEAECYRSEDKLREEIRDLLKATGAR